MVETNLLIFTFLDRVVANVFLGLPLHHNFLVDKLIHQLLVMLRGQDVVADNEGDQ